MPYRHRAGKVSKSPIYLSVLVIVLAGVSVLLFVKYRTEANSNPVNKGQQLTQQLSRLVEMPAGQAVISTVLNRTRLTNPILAKEARDGDKIFIFPKAKRLILYRPADKKVVDMLTIRE